MRVVKIGFSYLKIRLFPIKKERSLEDFFINRFGKELYKTFFKDYTKKVWGVECKEIDASWGAQRVKGVSISKAIWHALKSLFATNKSIEQKNVETSLIGRFMYPKFGPGHMWETVAKLIEEKGGKILLHHKVVGIDAKHERVTKVVVENKKDKKVETFLGDYFFSSMPVKDLIESWSAGVDKRVSKVARGLVYRDFITVGLLLKKLHITNQTNIKTVNNIVPDNWIYIQERDVKIGRLQIFNNWSPYMVKDLNNTWIGLEYFCDENDELWSKPDCEFINFAIDELCKIGVVEKEDVLDSVIIRMPKTYPAYFGTYAHFDLIKDFLFKYDNLYLIGRNGMHRYNNMDHSMLTAMQAVENIVNEVKNQENIWAINAQEEYHEEKASN
jgi:protoporphyrinogen oxidase